MPDELQLRLYDGVESLYVNNTSNSIQSAWQAEKETVERRLRALVRELDGKYVLERALGVGGGGIVLVARSVPMPEESVAVKMPRPSPGEVDRLNHILLNETAKLRQLHHEHIIRILLQGQVSGRNDEFPFYVLKFLEGASDADDYMRSHPTDEALLRLASEAMAALTFCHENGILHLDVKPKNIFVDGSGRATLADLGFAKALTGDSETANVGGTERYMHPELLMLMKKKDESGRLLAEEVLRSRLRPAFDLYSFGVSLLELIGIVDAADESRQSTYARRYLRVLACRLLDGKNDERQTALGLDREAFGQLRYESAATVLLDVRKLRGDYSVIEQVPEVSRHSKAIIQVASHGTLAFTPRVRRLLETAEVRRLARVSQLGLLSLVYPTASHSRLEHTLGTCAMVCRYLRALYSDPENPLFRQIINDDDVRAVLAAALLHDIGHFPLAHDLEEVDSSLISHSERTVGLLERSGELRAALSEEGSSGGWGIDPDRVIGILEANPDDGTGSVKDQILHSIIDGPIDADKVDYLLRDSENLRLPYGRGVDYERILQCLTVVTKTQSGSLRAKVGIHERGRIAAESLAFARYASYGSAYWHHTHRAAKAMVATIVWLALEQLRDAGERQYRQKLRDLISEALGEYYDPQGRLGIDGLRPQILGTSAVDPGTEFILRTLAQHGGAQARGLCDALVDRRIHKRALVLTRARSKDVPWAQLDSLTRRWEPRFELQRRLQSRISTATLERCEQGLPDESRLDDTIVSDFRTVWDSEPIVLLDTPVTRSGADSPLEYLCEEAHLEYPDPFPTGELTESSIWYALGYQTQQTIMKTRLFVSERFRSLITFCVAAPELERFVKEEIRETHSRWRDRL